MDFDVTSRLERTMERVLWVLVAGVRVIFMHLTKSWANCVLAGVMLVYDSNRATVARVRVQSIKKAFSIG